MADNIATTTLTIRQEQAKAQYEANKDVRQARKLEKIPCTICGTPHARGAMARHEKTKGHLDKMKEQGITENPKREAKPKAKLGCALPSNYVQDPNEISVKMTKFNPLI